MTDLYTPTLVRESVAAAKRRLGVPSDRDAALLARAGVRPAADERPTLVARGAHKVARGLERLAARLDRIGAPGAPHATARLARR